MKKIISVLFILTIITTQSFGNLLLTRDEAFSIAFPDADSVEKMDIFLNKTQVEKIEALSYSRLDSKIYIFYKFTNGNDTLGYAVINTHLLRTKSETVMYVIDNEGRLINAEILAFFEPSEYMQSDKWLELFANRNLDKNLRIDRDIPNITGATITTHAFTESVRKVLAIFQVAVIRGKN
jgi:hypothetical protein